MKKEKKEKLLIDLKEAQQKIAKLSDKTAEIKNRPKP